MRPQYSIERLKKSALQFEPVTGSASRDLPHRASNASPL